MTKSYRASRNEHPGFVATQKSRQAVRKLQTSMVQKLRIALYSMAFICVVVCSGYGKSSSIQSGSHNFLSTPTTVQNSALASAQVTRFLKVAPFFEVDTGDRTSKSDCEKIGNLLEQPTQFVVSHCVCTHHTAMLVRVDGVMSLST